MPGPHQAPVAVADGAHGVVADDQPRRNWEEVEGAPLETSVASGCRELGGRANEGPSSPRRSSGMGVPASAEAEQGEVDPGQGHVAGGGDEPAVGPGRGSGRGAEGLSQRAPFFFLSRSGRLRVEKVLGRPGRTGGPSSTAGATSTGQAWPVGRGRRASRSTRGHWPAPAPWRPSICLRRNPYGTTSPPPPTPPPHPPPPPPPPLDAASVGLRPPSFIQDYSGGPGNKYRTLAAVNCEATQSDRGE